MTFNFPGIKVGVAENPAGPTGCTIITLPQWSLLTADIRGGSPGARWWAWSGLVDAVCFAGAWRRRRRGMKPNDDSSHGVPGLLCMKRSVVVPRSVLNGIVVFLPPTSTVTS